MERAILTEEDMRDEAALEAILRGESMEVAPQEFARMMAEAQYLIKDPDVMKEAKKDKRIKKLIASLSTMIRTTFITDKNTLKIMKARWRVACRLELLILPEEPASYGEFQSWLNFGEAVMDDAFNGWRGKLLAEKIRTYRIERSSAKRKKILGFL